MKNNTVSLKKKIKECIGRHYQQRNAHPWVLVPFSHRCGETLNKDPLEERANICSWRVSLQFTMVGKVWQQEHRTAAHATSVIRKQRNECLSSARFLLLHRSGCQSMG